MKGRGERTQADFFLADWLEGVLLIASYLIIALSAWFYPHETTDSRCPEKP